jgi:hypothetical protein
VADIDVRGIIGEVAARHGVRLDSDDPLLVALTANGIVLEHLAQRMIADIRLSTSLLQKAALESPAAANALLMDVAIQAADSVRRAVEADIAGAGLKARAIVDAVHRANSRQTKYKWLALGLAGALIHFLLGVWAGRATP